MGLLDDFAAEQLLAERAARRAVGTGKLSPEHAAFEYAFTRRARIDRAEAEAAERRAAERAEHGPRRHYRPTRAQAVALAERLGMQDELALWGWRRFMAHAVGDDPVPYRAPALTARERRRIRRAKARNGEA